MGELGNIVSTENFFDRLSNKALNIFFRQKVAVIGTNYSLQRFTKFPKVYSLEDSQKKINFRNLLDTGRTLNVRVVQSTSRV